MTQCYILDPTSRDPGSRTRGGGRFIQLLKENLTEVAFIDELKPLDMNSILIVPFFDPFQPPILTKRLAKKQIIVIYDVIPLKYSHQFPVGIKGTVNVWRNRQALKNFDEIVTISETSKKDIIKYLNISGQKVKVIYPTLGKSFVDSSVAKTPQNNKLPSQYCIYVGDVNWNKNIANMAKAIKLANIPCICVGKAFETLKTIDKSDSATPAFSQASHVALFGSPSAVVSPDLSNNFSHPWQKEFKQFMYEVKDNPLFIFPGYVSDSDLIDLYKNASVNLLLSRDEGFGFSYLEASNISTPSLLSDIGIFHEIAQDGAVFVNPEEPEEIAKQITSTMINKNLSQKAKERSLFFSQERFIKAWNEVLTM